MAKENGETNIKEVITPDLGMDHPVPIAEIFVEPGQKVKKEDPLLSLESEKAVMDLPSPFEGVIKEILVELDQEISSGDIIMIMETGGAVSTAAESTAAESPSILSNSPVPIGTVPAEAASPRGVSHITDKSHASPSVRLYGRELGVDLSLVNGTGPKNRVRREDVQAFVKQAVLGKGNTSSGSGLPQLPYVDPAGFGGVTQEKLTGIQKITGTHLHASWVNIPHVTHYEKADVTELESWRKSLNSQKPISREATPRKYTSLAFVVKALSQAIKEFPRFNSVLAPEGDSLFIRDYYNIGIAVDTPKGLLVPVIQNTDKKGIGEIADEIIELAGRGRESKLKPIDLKGASITITNLGGIGGTSFTPIINPPEVAILGLSRSIMEPVWTGSEFVPRLMLPLSLSYDHRVIDGALAAKFAARLAVILKDMKTILL